MKIIAAVAGVVVLASVVLTMLGKPPNLPLGPLKGALAGGEEPATDTSSTPTTPSIATNPCPPGQILAGDASTGAGATGTDTTGAGATGAGATGAGATGAGATGAGATGAGATGAGATGAGATGTTPGADTTANGGVPPVTGAIMSGVSYDGDAPRMLRVADVSGTPSATDPTGAATGAGATGAGATGTPTTPATGATGATASAGAADPSASGQASCIPDPALGGASGAGATGTSTTPTTPGVGTPGATTPTTPAATKSTTDGTNSGNSPEALRVAAEIANVMKTVNLNVSATATLFPGVGGASPIAQRKVYRSRVTAAVVVIKLTDATTVQQWGGAGKPTQITLVKSFIQRLGKNYPKASRSVTVTDSTGNVLAIGDATPGGGAKAGKVLVY